MNYLAHSILSFSEGQLVGNLIADFVRNADREKYPADIREGIRLHRGLDTFTDAHPLISEAKKIFQPAVRLYSGAFVDVAFDHFLALSLDERKLRQHADTVYLQLNNPKVPMPDKARAMAGRMQEQDWLYSYRFAEQIRYPMANVIHRAKYLTGSEPAFAAFLHHYDELRLYFEAFFPELQAYVAARYMP